MDEKKEPPEENVAQPGAEKPSITEGVSNLISSTVGAIKESVKDAASSLTELAKNPPLISNRIETAVPPVDENYDAPPMTADEIAEHAAAEIQPVAATRRARRRRIAPKTAPKKTKNSAKHSTGRKATKKRKGIFKASSKKANKTSAKKGAKKKK